MTAVPDLPTAGRAQSCAAQCHAGRGDRGGGADRRPRPSRFGVFVRHRIGRAAQTHGRCRSRHPRDLSRHRMAVRGNAGLSRHPDRDARVCAMSAPSSRWRRRCAGGSGSRIVVLRSRCLLPDPQGRTAEPCAGAVQRLDQRPQAFPGRPPRRDPGRRTGWRTAEIQSIRQCLARADRGHLCARPICRRIRWWPPAFSRSAACPAPAAARPDEDARAGRWRGRPKTECGIHTVKTSRISPSFRVRDHRARVRATLGRLE